MSCLAGSLRGAEGDAARVPFSFQGGEVPAFDRLLLLRMFRSAVQPSVMDIPSAPQIRDDLGTLPLLSLESRLGLLRRRRRLTFLKRVAAMGPVIVGMSLLLLVGFGGMASAR
jgi:hypothetical protein